MKTLARISAAALVGGAIVAAAWSAAQRPEATDPQPGIALLNVSHLFKHHPDFRERLSEMREEATGKEQDFKERTEKLQRLKDKLLVLGFGDQQRAQREAEINQLSAELQRDMQTLRTSLAGREAQLYLDLYEDIEAEVSAYAKQHRLSAVLRYASDPVDRTRLDSIQSHINRPVVWHDGRQDITQAIMQRIGERGKK